MRKAGGNPPRRLLQIARDFGERRRKLRADRFHPRNDRDADESGDESIFDRRCSVFVIPICAQNPIHTVSPFCECGQAIRDREFISLPRLSINPLNFRLSGRLKNMSGRRFFFTTITQNCGAIHAEAVEADRGGAVSLFTRGHDMVVDRKRGWLVAGLRAQTNPPHSTSRFPWSSVTVQHMTRPELASTIMQLS